MNDLEFQRMTTWLADVAKNEYKAMWWAGDHVSVADIERWMLDMFEAVKRIDKRKAPAYISAGASLVNCGCYETLILRAIRPCR